MTAKIASSTLAPPRLVALEERRSSSPTPSVVVSSRAGRVAVCRSLPSPTRAARVVESGACGAAPTRRARRRDVPCPPVADRVGSGRLLYPTSPRRQSAECEVERASVVGVHAIELLARRVYGDAFCEIEWSTTSRRSGSMLNVSPPFCAGFSDIGGPGMPRDCLTNNTHRRAVGVWLCSRPALNP